MNKVLLTWNSNGKFMPNNVRESHRAAADRWGAEYVELTDKLENPFRQKAWMLADAKGDRVMWIDADAIIRFDCPSPFELCSESEIGCVRNFQAESDDEQVQFWQKHDWWYVQTVLRTQMPFRRDYFCNTGMLVFSPRIHSVIWRLDYPSQPNLEQALMNGHAESLGFVKRFLPDGFNKLGIEVWRPGPMAHFVQHLAAFRSRTERWSALEAIDWTCAAVELEAAA